MNENRRLEAAGLVWEVPGYHGSSAWAKEAVS